MKKLESIRIVVVGNQDYKYLFEKVVGSPIDLESDRYASVLAKANLKDDFQGKKDKNMKSYSINWVQAPLKFPYGREWWLKMKKFMPNAIFFFLESETQPSFYKAAMQEYYNKLLDLLDPDPKKADKLAKNLKILFLFVMDTSVDRGSLTKDLIVELQPLRLIYAQKFNNAAFREVMFNLKNPEKEDILDLLQMVKQVFEEE